MNSQLSHALRIAALGAGAYFTGRFVVRMLTNYSFRDRVVVITGGSRGLGLVMARQLAREGARLALLARDEGELRRAVDELAPYAEVAAIPCDVASRAQIQQAVQTVVGRFGGIDVLMNCAGVIQVGPWSEMTLHDCDEAMKAHFWGPLMMIDAVLPIMRNQGEGRIVNIASIGGKIAVPHLVPYCASKFALVGLSQGLRIELARENILVTTICPGLMRTGSHLHAKFKGHHREEFTAFSVSNALPVVSTSAEAAARRILQATREGRAELTFTLPAKMAALANGIAPGLVSEIMTWVNGMLPGEGGIGAQALPGSESQSSWSPSWLTSLVDQAAERNNEAASASGAT